MRIPMCDRQRELLDVYQQAASRFSVTLEALNAAQAAGVVKQDYDRFHGYVEQTRTASEQARLELERHVAEHGCDYFNTDSGGD